MGLFDSIFGSKPQRQPQSAEEKALAEIGAKNWNFFAENYATLPAKLQRLLAPQRDMPRVLGGVTAGVRAGTRDRGLTAAGLVGRMAAERGGLNRAASAAYQSLFERETKAALNLASTMRTGQGIAIRGLGQLAADAVRVTGAKMGYDTARGQFVPNLLGTGLGAVAGGLYMSDRLGKIRNPFAPQGQ